MTAPVFVATNLLLYAADTSDAAKHRAASVWRLELWKSRRGRLSYQVLQEFYVQAVRKNPRGAAAVEAEVRDLFAWDPVVIDVPVIEAAWRLRKRFGLSFWDALIVGAETPRSWSTRRSREDLITGWRSTWFVRSQRARCRGRSPGRASPLGRQRQPDA